jgi:superfamily II DNA or RNA helicase
VARRRTRTQGRKDARHSAWRPAVTPSPTALDPGPFADTPEEDLETLHAPIVRARDSVSQSLADRGRSYKARVLAISHDLDTGQIRARVSGTQETPYEVTVSISGIHAEAVCTCAYSDGFLKCKHGWAVLDRVAGHLEARRTELSERSEGTWRRRLAELDTLLGPPAGQAGESRADRVVWRVGLSDEGVIEVTPFLQKRRSGGGFTKGRKLALERLVIEDGDTYGTEAREIAALIEVQRVRGSGWYAYRQSRYHLDACAALDRLVGSPRVYWDDDPDDPVEVARAIPGLALVPDPDDHPGAYILEPALDGDPWPESGRYAVGASAIVFVPPDRDRICVSRLARRELELFDWAMKERPCFPADSVPVLLDRLPRVSARLRLALPEQLEAERVASDSRLVLRLTPRQGTGDGLGIVQVEGWVRPFPGAPLERPGLGPDEVLATHEGSLARVARRLEDERSRLEGVTARFGLARFRQQAPHSFQLPPDDALALVEALAAEAKAGSKDVILEWPETGRVRVAGPISLADLSISVSTEQDWFGIAGGVEVDEQALSLVQLLDAMGAGREYIQVDGSTWVRVTDDLRDRLSGIHLATQRSGKKGLRMGHEGIPWLEELTEGIEALVLDEGFRLRSEALREAFQDPAVAPASLTATLRPYQREGVAWLLRTQRFSGGACLADEMGLGKTVQALALLLERAERGVGPTLVLAPTSVCFGWEREAARFAPSLTPRIYRGTARKAALENLGPNDLVITSYDLARLDKDALGEIEWGTLVLDEAQRIKNATTKTARAVRGFRAGFRLALTGTPLENHLGELYSLFRVLVPTLLGTFASFRERFMDPIERAGRSEHRDHLARLIRPFVLRRKKKDVLSDLPPRTDVPVLCELSDREQLLYDAARLQAVRDLGQGGKGSAAPRSRKAPEGKRFQVLAALTRLRQLACHPKLVDSSWRGGSAKLGALLELVQEVIEGDHQALIFSQFVGHLSLIRAELEKQSISYCYLDGKTALKDRVKAIDAFQAGEAPLFLISLRAGGTGLNLTAADSVIHMDPWWNPAVEDQASDRAHRIGQTRPVTVYRLIARGTIEEQVLALHEKKRDLIASVLTGTDRAAKLGLKDLIELLGSQ